ncbi:unnamed protein product [Boreogadus saida]
MAVSVMITSESSSIYPTTDVLHQAGPSPGRASTSSSTRQGLQHDSISSFSMAPPSAPPDIDSWPLVSSLSLRSTLAPQASGPQPLSLAFSYSRSPSEGFLTSSAEEPNFSSKSALVGDPQGSPSIQRGRKSCLITGSPREVCAVQHGGAGARIKRTRTIKGIGIPWGRETTLGHLAVAVFTPNRAQICQCECGQSGQAGPIWPLGRGVLQWHGPLRTEWEETGSIETPSMQPDQTRRRPLFTP